MNICYIGVENPMSAAAFGCTEKNLVLRTGNGYFVKNGDGHYTYHPERPGTAVIAAYCRKGRDSVLLGELPFRVKELPAPRAVVAGKSSGSISKTVLLAQAGIAAVLEGFDFDAPFRVTAYEFSIKRLRGPVTASVPVTGPYFTTEVKAAMQTLASGDRILLDAVQCIGPDGKTRSCGSIELTVD